jgi:chitin disaccharide deacetylase
VTARLLVINADDFGLTPGVCTGILRAHRDGVVTSTSALTAAPAFAQHARALVDSGLDAGVHLAVVGEDPPLLSAREVPSLVDNRGRLALTWRTFLRRSALGIVDIDDVRREWSAQLDAAASAGLHPTHLDSHQNVHLWPPLGALLVHLAVDRSISAIRVAGSLRVGPVYAGVRVLGAALRHRARSTGLAVADLAAGLDHAGALDYPTLRATIDRLAAGRGHADLTTHPGEGPDPDRSRYRWGYAWPEELRALCDTGIRRHILDRGFSLGSFADLATLERR